MKAKMPEGVVYVASVHASTTDQTGCGCCIVYDPKSETSYRIRLLPCRNHSGPRMLIRKADREQAARFIKAYRLPFEPYYDEYLKAIVASRQS